MVKPQIQFSDSKAWNSILRKLNLKSNFQILKPECQFQIINIFLHNVYLFHFLYQNNELWVLKDTFQVSIHNLEF